MEPKSIAELRNDFDIKHIKGVKKGPDSVEFGERWLDDLDFICIDPKRTHKIAFEFENIDYQVKHIKGVKKGPDSVEFGERWLDDLDFICIDPKRTHKIAFEFENIDYQVDRDGNPKPRLEDKDNHAIDATRYAMSEDMRKTKSTIKTFRGGL